MNKLTKKQVEHVAQLARLGLTNQEKEKFSQELSSILELFQKLNEVKTDKIEPIAQITGLENITRKDKGRKKTKQETEKLISLAPEIEGRHVKVKAIL